MKQKKHLKMLLILAISPLFLMLGGGCATDSAILLHQDRVYVLKPGDVCPTAPLPKLEGTKYWYLIDNVALKAMMGVTIDSSDL